MERTLIIDLEKKVGEKTEISGFVRNIRDHGKVIFIDLSDRSAEIQCVIPSSADKFEEVKTLTKESVVSLVGIIKERPDNSKKEVEMGHFEYLIEDLSIHSIAEELPFELDSEINLDTQLNYRPFTLRRKKDVALFKLQNCLINSYRKTLNEKEFTEFVPPVIVGDDAEGGAEVFSVEYFKSKANLATSPQLYKQILVGVFERAFSIAKVFRAETHSTSRHLNEYISMDFEMGFIDDYVEVMDTLEDCMRDMVKTISGEEKIMSNFEIELPKLPTDKFPKMKLSVAHEILEKEFNIIEDDKSDLSPEQERKICEYAAKEFNSDFIFITHYPVSKRPMYAYRDEKDNGLTLSFDLLFRGVEIASGGQRINNYDELVKSIKEKIPNVDMKNFEYYLQAFKYGMPKHGGIGMGLERLTAKFAGVKNVKEASMFPRDMNRIDKLLYE